MLHRFARHRAQGPCQSLYRSSCSVCAAEVSPGGPLRVLATWDPVLGFHPCMPAPSAFSPASALSDQAGIGHFCPQCGHPTLSFSLDLRFIFSLTGLQLLTTKGYLLHIIFEMLTIPCCPFLLGFKHALPEFN